MKSRLAHEMDGLRTYVIVFEKGEEPKSGLERFARENDITGASITAIGAFSEATLAFFDPEVLDYLQIPIARQVEVLSFLGDIAIAEEGPFAHVHVVVGKPDGTTAGGHLKAARVWPTLEVVLQETPPDLRRRSDPSTGLALIDPTSREPLDSSADEKSEQSAADAS